jgi:hypothetical protein
MCIPNPRIGLAFVGHTSSCIPHDHIVRHWQCDNKWVLQESPSHLPVPRIQSASLNAETRPPKVNSDKFLERK